MTTIVNGLDKEFGSALQCDVLDSTTEDSKQAIAGYGFDDHGLVVFEAGGDVSWKKNGHHISEEELRAALKVAMEGV